MLVADTVLHLRVQSQVGTDRDNEEADSAEH